MAKEYVKRVRNTWTDPEEATLRSGKIPETRTYSQAYLKAKLLGIPPPPSPTGRHKWTPDEDTELREKGTVKGRSTEACKAHAYSLGLRITERPDGSLMVTDVKTVTPKRMALLKRAGILFALSNEGLNYTEISKLVGLSRQSICSLIKKYRASNLYADDAFRAKSRIQLLLVEYEKLGGKVLRKPKCIKNIMP